MVLDRHSSAIPLRQLQSIYFTSVGRNTTLMFNVAAGDQGQLDPQELDLLRQFGAWYETCTGPTCCAINLCRGYDLGTRGGTRPGRWMTTCAPAGGGQRSDLGPAGSHATVAHRFPVISIREPIESGERATSYHVEIRQNGIWNRTPVDASGATIAGTVIGQRQLWQLGPRRWTPSRW